jgi:hypothetical protein
MEVSGRNEPAGLVVVLAALLVSFWTWASGCVHVMPHEAFIWDDEAPIIEVHRADVVEAEAAVIRYLRTHGRFLNETTSCRGSPRSYRMHTSETPEAYQVILEHNVNLCDMPDLLDPPPHLRLSASHGPEEYAVSKKDLRIMRVRVPGDETRQSRAGEPTPRKPAPPTHADGGPNDGPGVPNRCPDGGYVTLEGDFIRLSEHFHQVPIIYPECVNRLVPQDPPSDAGQEPPDAGW